MIRASAVNVYLLQKHKIRADRIYDLSHGADRRHHTFLIFRPGGLSSIHEKAVIPPVSAKPDIIGHNKICPLRFEGKVLIKIRILAIPFDFKS